jgi:RHS repeat-associated protein
MKNIRNSVGMAKLIIMALLFVTNAVCVASPVKVRVSNYNFSVYPRPSLQFYSVSMDNVRVESSSYTFFYYVCCSPGEAPWEIAPFDLVLQDGVAYDCKIEPPANHGYCCGDHDTRYMQITAVDACSSAIFYVGGNASVGNATIPFDPWNPVTHVMIMVKAQDVLFHWDYPKDGVQSLLADGASIISGTATNGSDNLAWSFDGADLGCKLLLTNGPVVIVQAGTNTGTVYVKAVSGSGTKCTRQPLKLVSCNGGGCAACQGGGDLTMDNQCVDFKLNLGWSFEGGTADYLHIREENPSSIITTPQALHYDFQHSDVQVYTNAVGISQIRAPRLLVNIVTNTYCKYSIQLYNLTNIAGALTNGVYPLTNTPYRTITVENPSGNTNQVLFTDSNDGSTYYFDWQTNGWLLTSGSGLQKKLKTTVNTNGVSISTTTISAGTSAPALTKMEVWQSVAAGGQRLTMEVTGSGSAAKTNTYAYNANGFLQQATRWDGSWEYYFYDSYNRPIQIYSGFLNQSPTTNSSLCKLTVNNYSTDCVSGSGDNGLAFFMTPRCVIQSIQGQEVSRKYFVGLPGQRREIQCVTPGVAWNNSSNLVTVYNLFTNGFRLNEPWQVKHPDGTAEIYQYTDAMGQTVTNMVWSGHLDSTGTNIDDGFETIQVIDPAGLLLSKAVVDIKSGILTSKETYFYDSLNRPVTTVFLDGTYVQRNYDCCTIESQQGRDGTTTSYSHDLLHRLLTSTQNNITTSNAYDAAGNILATYRFGNDDSGMITSQSAYDDAGQQIASTDALNHTTTFSNYFDGLGQLVKQTTYADSSTRLETYYSDGTLQSIEGTAVSPVRYEYGAESDGGNLCNYTKSIQLNSDGSDTGNWTKTYVDGVGHVYKTIYADGSTSLSSYNPAGQLSSQTDADGLLTLYQYDGAGRLVYTALDMNANGAIDFNGSDRITASINDVTSDNGTYVNRSRTFVWKSPGSNSSNLVSTVEASVDGLQKWNVSYNGGVGITNYSLTQYLPTSGKVISKNVSPDGSYTTSTSQYGRLVSVNRKDATAMPITQTIYGYDAYGRQNTMTDDRNGTTTYYFNNADQVVSTITPSPDGVLAGLVTTNILDSMGRVVKTTHPDDTSVTNSYYANGLLQQTAGSRTYPVQYTYDSQGRMKTMTTWTNFASNAGAAVTTWNYDDSRGFLTNKAYADGKGPNYTYTSAGRLKTRNWVRGITSTYGYDNAGGLSTVSYSDSTPGLGYGYDRQGHQIAVTNGATVCNWTFNDLGQMTSESYTGGPLDGVSVTNGYDALLRRTNLTALAGGIRLSSANYGYDTVSRLQTVSDGTNSASYGYVENSPLVGNIVFQRNGQIVMTTIKQYDYLNRLTSIGSSRSQFLPVNSFAYNYNLAGQRTSVTNNDNTYWQYQYDSLGQVISGKKYWADGTPVAGQQFTYNFDDIGNRKSTASGGDASGNNLRTANYTANNLNQYTSRDVPGYVTLLGSANPDATVTVNLQRAARQGDYFWDELPVDNSSSPLWLSLTNLAVLNQGTNLDILATNTGNVFLPKTPEIFGYDADGNLTNNGRRAITWDAENRALSFTTVASATAAARRKVDCAYDYLGRRIQKIVSTNNGSVWIPVSTNRYVYDGWNLVAILNPDAALSASFMWGLDLSGTLQGAGGVGGLLAMTLPAGPNAGTYDYTYDGNGNVMTLVNAANGSVAGQWEYDPFGNPQRATGLLAGSNPFLFSTKFYDVETGLFCYGYRYYDASSGMWPNRDLIEEEGGVNLYGFVNNNTIYNIDRLGLAYGEHLTEKEAKQLACAINLWLKDADLFTPFLPENSSSYRPWSVELLTHFMSKDGSTVYLPYSLIENEAQTTSANEEGRRQINSGLTSTHVYLAQMGWKNQDISTALGRVVFHYQINHEGGINGEIRDHYTFLDTRSDEHKKVPLKGLSWEGIVCCWKGGDIVDDKWMSDLEKYGYAKGFYTVIQWQLSK